MTYIVEMLMNWTETLTENILIEQLDWYDDNNNNDNNNNNNNNNDNNNICCT